MFSSAANLALVLAGSASVGQAKEVQAAWKLAAPSVIRLKDGLSVVGSAVLIDPSGYFIASKVSGMGLITGVSSQGTIFPLTRVATDDATGLMLLQASMWRDANARPIRPALSTPKGTPVIIVMSGGLESGEISNPNRGGVLPQSKRLVFLTEVKLENPTPNLGGAPVFTYQGEFVGLLNANLQSSASRQVGQTQMGLSQQFEGGGISPAPVAAKSLVTTQNYGPSSLFVAYALGPEMLQRVISGFMSPNHQVLHPFIGLYVRDTGAGAEVQAINAKSPAAQTDLKPGDLILSVGGSPISNRLDYARSLLHLKVGDSVTVTYMRAGTQRTVTLTVARMSN